MSDKDIKDRYGLNELLAGIEIAYLTIHNNEKLSDAEKHRLWSAYCITVKSLTECLESNSR